mgnify:CR=1 FL=1
MKTLVIGGAGYIGSHIVYELIDQGHDVIILDNLSTGIKMNIDPRALFVNGSTHSNDDLNKVMKVGVDVVIHLGEYKAAGESMINPRKYAYNNLIGSINLLNACLRNGIKTFIYSSSAAVYGQPQYIPVNEDHPLKPISYYGELKYQIERNLAWFSNISDIGFAILRYFNVSGYDVKGRIRGKENNPTNLIPLVLEVASGVREKIEIFGNDYDTHDGTGIRDYIHVNDLAISHAKAMEYVMNNKKNLIVNIATGEGHSVFDVIEKAELITKKDILYNIAERRPGDPDRMIAISDKISELLKWEAKFSDLETIIKTAWNVYK